MDIRREHTFGFYPLARDIQRQKLRDERESITRLWKNLRQSTPSNMSTYTPTGLMTARPNTTPILQHGSYTPAPLSTRSVSRRTVDPATIEAKRQRLVDIVGEKNAALEQQVTQTPAAERRSRRGQCGAFRDLDTWLPSSDRRVRRSREGRQSAIRSSRCTSKAGDYSLRYLEGPETNPIQNISSTFYKTLDEPSKHFFIDPDWVSEGLTIKKLHLENKINPLRYGWI